MKVLFGHPTGAPFSHHAALAHYEAGRLAAFCVPWMPAPNTISRFRRVPGLRSWAARLERRTFPPLLAAPRIHGRFGEWKRMGKRILLGRRVSTEALAYEANDWLMRTMARHSRRNDVDAVHAYEDCSLWQFEEAKRRGKLCIYDLPIGYYEAWQDTQAQLTRQYHDWLPAGGLPAARYVRPAQKRREMELADVVVVPSTFVENTTRAYYPQKRIIRASYGVDTDFWRSDSTPDLDSRSVASNRPLRFVYAGGISLRKGIPVLLAAWSKAALKDAELFLVGAWHLAEAARSALPANVHHVPPCSSAELRRYYQSADVFVFPSFFEGRALVVAEAMACGLPVITTPASGYDDIETHECGRIVSPGNTEELISALRWAGQERAALPEMGNRARERAIHCSWAAYRSELKNAEWFQ
jgi:alpha-maltose-1-phosphate synthase